MIELVEVSPRDGLQNEPVVLSVAARIELVERALAAGVRRIEVASFVNPARVPQMAHAEEVIAGLPDRSDVTYIGLVLNRRGAERALATSVDELGLVCVASDTFGHANQGQSVDDSVAMAIEVLGLAQSVGRRAQVTISVAFGCPFAGAVNPALVVDIARRLAAAGFTEVALADTIGIARPHEVTTLVAQVRAAVGPATVRVHMHDTRGMAVANTLAALREGATVVDASLAGSGGCPFAPGSAGNAATEDLAFALGDALAVDQHALVSGARWLAEQLGRKPRSAMSNLELNA